MPDIDEDIKKWEHLHVASANVKWLASLQKHKHRIWSNYFTSTFMEQMKDHSNRNSNESFHISIIHKSPEVEYSHSRRGNSILINSWIVKHAKWKIIRHCQIPFLWDDLKKKIHTSGICSRAYQILDRGRVSTWWIHNSLWEDKPGLQMTMLVTQHHIGTWCHWPRTLHLKCEGYIMRILTQPKDFKLLHFH